MIEINLRRATWWSDVTLIEVLIVVVIVGIIAAIAIPKFFPPNQRAMWVEACHRAGGTPHYPYRAPPICLPPGAAIPLSVQP